MKASPSYTALDIIALVVCVIGIALMIANAVVDSETNLAFIGLICTGIGSSVFILGRNARKSK